MVNTIAQDKLRNQLAMKNITIGNKVYKINNTWIQNEEGCGRNIGEACHIYDLFNFFTESEYEDIQVNSLNDPNSFYKKSDNFIASITYGDGSICNLTYTSMGSSKNYKEKMTLHCGGESFYMNDYLNLSSTITQFKNINHKVRDKGHFDELVELKNGIRQGFFPISIKDQIQATEISLKIEDLFGE